MPAPSSDLIVADPAPLNPLTTFPFIVDEFPAGRLLDPINGLVPAEMPHDAPANPNLKEQR